MALTHHKRITGYSYHRSDGKKIIVKSYLKNVNTKKTASKSRKKSITKEWTKSSVRYDRNPKGKGGRRVSKRTKPIHKVPVKTKHDTRRKSRIKTKRVSRQIQVKVKHPRNKHQIELIFKGSRKIEKKILAVNHSEEVKKAIANQLKRKEGRPPRGFIIIVSDKKGNTTVKKSPADMVVNEDSIQSLLKKYTEELGDTYQQYLADGEGNEEEDYTPDEREDYEDYNPDNIVSIMIRFFYGKI